MIKYYLAAEDEQTALQLLRETAPTGVTEEMLQAELGARYTQLSQIVLRRRESRVLPKPLNELLPRLRVWLQRALALNEQDPVAHFLAADIAFHADQFEESTRLIERALEKGLPVKEAWKFLTIARQKKPGIESIETLWERLSKIMQEQTHPVEMKPIP